MGIAFCLWLLVIHIVTKWEDNQRMRERFIDELIDEHERENRKLRIQIRDQAMKIKELEDRGPKG